MSNPLRLGVIGAGSWTVASHLPNVLAHAKEVDLVGVCRKGQPQLDQLRDRFGFRVASEDYRDVLAAGVDACIVASPTALHHEHAKAALEAGAHVLVEKPVTVRASDAWDLVDTAQRRDRHLVCAFGWNYMPLFTAAASLMTQPGIGAVEHVSIRMASFTRELLANRGTYPKAAKDALPDPATWTKAELSGGGYAQAQLSHALAATLWLTGLSAARVFALMASPLGAPVELHDAMAIEFEGGAIGTLSGASSHSDANGVKENELDIHVIGEDGQFSLQVGEGRGWLARGSERFEIDLPESAGAYDCVGPVHALIELAMGAETPNRSPGELGARTVEVLQAAYESAVGGAAVETARRS